MYKSFIMLNQVTAGSPFLSLVLASSSALGDAPSLGTMATSIVVALSSRAYQVLIGYAPKY